MLLHMCRVFKDQTGMSKVTGRMKLFMGILLFLVYLTFYIIVS